jgi:hypothetical protein
MVPELIGGTVLVCSAVHIPIFVTLRAKLKAAEAARQELASERRQFFEGIQEKAAANATTLCRTCSACKRVVHRYRPFADGVICKECDVETKTFR